MFEGFAQFIGGIFSGDMDMAVAGLKILWDGLKSYYQTLWNGITGIFSWAWDTVIKPITDALGITDHIIAAWQSAQVVFNVVLNAIAGAFDAAWARIKPVIDAMQAGVNAAETLMNRLNGSRDGPISSGP